MIEGETGLMRADSSVASERRPASGESAAPPARVLLGALLDLLLVAAVVRWIVTAVTDVTSKLGIYDFSFYYVEALALRENPHANIYDPRVLRAVADAHHLFLPPGQFQYPPLLPILTIPLTALSFETATRLWLFFNLLLWLAGTALLASVFRHALAGGNAASAPPMGASRRGLLGRWYGLPDETRFAIAAAAFISLTYAPLAQATWLGQISMLLFFLLVLVPWLLARRNPALAGAVLALATLIKLFPILLIGYYVLRGRWRVAAGAIGGMLLLTVAMLPVIGVSGLLAMRSILSNGLGDSTHYQNQSLSRVPMWIALEFGGQSTTATTLAGYALIALIALAFVAGVLLAPGRPWPVRRLPKTLSLGDSPADLLGCAWALCTMVLISPLTWEHYDAWLLPAFVLCLGYALRRLASGLYESSGQLKPEVLIVGAIILGYALTMSDLPFRYDTDATFTLGPIFLHHPVRPLFMLMRPIGTLLAWFAAGALFLRSQRDSVPAAQGAVVGVTSEATPRT